VSNDVIEYWYQLQVSDTLFFLPVYQRELEGF
jgi:hypothetical protein